jgi:hypothetical protein
MDKTVDYAKQLRHNISEHDRATVDALNTMLVSKVNQMLLEISLGSHSPALRFERSEGMLCIQHSIWDKASDYHESWDSYVVKELDKHGLGICHRQKFPVFYSDVENGAAVPIFLQSETENN